MNASHMLVLPMRDVLPRTSLDSRISLWRGDITTLAADAIVNAANSQMLGMLRSRGHFCIDNAIHTFAGVQLRAECSGIMREQGHPEPTGHGEGDEVGDNLPSKWIIHTAGPSRAAPRPESDRGLLACLLSKLASMQRKRSEPMQHRLFLLHKHGGLRVPSRRCGRDRCEDGSRLARLQRT